MGVGLDELLFRALNQAGLNPVLDLLMVVLTTFGIFYVQVLAGLILYWRGHRELGFDVIVLTIVTAVVVEALKWMLMRERPFEVLTDVHTISWGALTSAGGYSMPSGHVARAFALTTLIALGAPRRTGMLLLILAGLLAVSRIYLGLHWPSDVLAGALLGIALAVLFHWIGTKDTIYSKVRKRVLGSLQPAPKSS